MKLKKVSMSMREVCYLLSNGQIDDQPDVGINTIRAAYVKTPSGELAKINQVIKKTDVDMIRVTYGEHDITCAKKHSFLDANYNDVYASETEAIMTKSGAVDIDNIEDVLDTDAYDISIDAPHLYYTTNGTIHHNTLFGMNMVSAYMKAKPDSVCIFYDSEFGAGKDYFESNQIDTSRVIHIPIMNIEELKFDIIQKLEEIGKDDDVIIFVDSLGNLSSKKEVEDAKEEKSVADMTRAKMMKSLFRMVTPYLNMKNIPMIAICHTYNTMEMFSKPVVSGGTGIMLSSDTVWIIGRQQEKDGKELIGYNFIINVEKSRYVKEKSKIPIQVTFEGGINKWTGLLEAALLTGDVTKPSNGYYTRPHLENDKKVRAKDTNSKEFWTPVFEDTNFLTNLTKSYKLQSSGLIDD